MSTGAGAIRAGRAYIELFTSDKALKSGLASAEKSVMALGKTVKAVGAGLQDLGTRMATIGLGAAASLGVASQAFGDFEAGMARIKSNMPKEKDAAGLAKTAEATQDADRAIQNLVRTLGQRSGNVQKVYEELSKAGSDVDLTGPVVQFAKVASMAFDEAAVTVAKGTKIWKRSGEDIMNGMSSAADSSTLSLKDISDAAVMAAQVAKDAGLSFEEFTATLAMLGDAGMAGSDAGTAFKNMLANLTAATPEAKELMKELGLSAYDAAGRTKTFTEMIDNLQDVFSKLSDEERRGAMRKIMGMDAIRPGLVFLEKGTDGLKEMMGTMAGARSVAEKFDIQMDSLQGGLERLAAGADLASIALGAALKDSFARLIEIVAGTLKGVADLVVANKELVRTFVPIVAIVTAAGVALAALGIAIGLVTSPLGLVAIGLGAAAAALHKFTDVTKTFQTAWTAIGDLLKKGDLAGAARVGMLELQIIYQAGTLAILKIWDDWGNAMVDVIVDMAATARRIMVELGHDMVKMATLIASGTNTPLRVAWIANIEAQRQQLLEEIDAAELAERETRRGGSAKDIKDREKALQDARAELAKLAEEAKRRTDLLANPPPFVGPPKPDTAKAALEVGRGLDAAKDKVDVKGTFSAVAAGRALAGGDTVSSKLDDQIAIQEKELKELVKLNRKATPLVFSS
jgi:TP901 family phage tail tape measure protein